MAITSTIYPALMVGGAVMHELTGKLATLASDITDASIERPVRVLMLEDNPADAELIEFSLREAQLPIVAMCVETRDEFIRELERFSPDVVLADYSLPQFSGAAALQLMREMGLGIPFILVSGAVGDERAVGILKNGATDYVLKDNLLKLAPSIRRALSDAEERAKRHAAEASLLQQTNLFQMLLQAQSDIGLGLILIDVDRYVFVNDAYCVLIGYSREELMALPSISVLVAPDMRDEYMERIGHAEQGIQVEGHIESIIIHKDGHYIDVEASRKVVELDGRPVRMSIIRDITERKQAEADLTEFANKLRQSNQELERFAFAASHDLQEPLRKIQAFASRLKDKHAGQLNKDANDSLEYILNAAGRLEAMIKGVLTLSRVATRGQPFERINLGELARDVVADLELRIERTGARVELGYLPTIDADRAQMRQLLQNLIGNALKFQKGDIAPVVTVSSEALEPETGVLYRTTSQLTTSTLITSNLMTEGAEPGCAPAYRIIVQDNGVGFDEKFLDRIFMPFQRLHTASEFEGTGMGLAICRKIVERHDGTMTATSTPGCGARFVVTLPATAALEGRAHGR